MTGLSENHITKTCYLHLIIGRQEEAELRKLHGDRFDQLLDLMYSQYCLRTAKVIGAINNGSVIRKPILTLAVEDFSI